MLRRGIQQWFSLDMRFRQATKLDTTKIPYAVKRTASGNLPVYIITREINRDSVTCIGAVYGDTIAFISDLRMTVCGDAAIMEQGRNIEITGRYGKPVKKWLQSLGF